MLQKLNERLQGVFSWIIVILISITFAIVGVDYFMSSRQGGGVKVKVNGQDITKHDYNINLRRTMQIKDGEELSEANEVVIKQQVLDDMIANVVTVQSALKNGFLVTAEQANAAILNIPQFQENGQFSNSRYSQLLSNALYTHESFQEDVKKGMLINQQRFALVGTEFALPDELREFVKLYLQKRNYSYLQIPVAAFLNKVHVTDAEISDYYNKNAKAYYSPEQISLQYVQVSAEDIRRSIKVSEDEILRQYEENKTSYLSPARWKVAKITLKSNATQDNASKENTLNTVKFLKANPEMFSQKAVELTGSKETFAEIIAGDTEYDNYLIDLTKPQQVSDLIPTNSGYSIFKVISYNPAKAKEFNEVRDSIKEQLMVEKVQAKYAEILEKLADLSYQTPDSLDMVGKILNLKIHETGLFDNKGGSQDFTKNKNVLKTAFSHDVLELGNNSEPLQIDNDNVVVIRVNKRIPSKKIELVVVKEEIRRILSQQKAQNMAEQFGQDFVTKQTKQEKLDPVVISGKHLNWIAVRDAGRDSVKPSVDINELAFSISKVKQLTGKMLADNNYVIVSLENIKEGDFNTLDKEQAASINQQLESSYGLNDYQSYISELMRQAKIVRKFND